MVSNLFPKSLFELIETTWEIPCIIPHLYALKDIEAWMSMDKQDNPYASWFDASEKAQFSRYSFEKRSREWFAGRICIKAAIRSYQKTHQREDNLREGYATISNLDSGRPAIVGQEGSPSLKEPDISISHSSEYALGIAAGGQCGIDIQVTSEKLTTLQRRFCTHHEALALEMVAEDEVMGLTLLWAVKEAAKKALSRISMPGFLDLTLSRVQKEKSGYIFTLTQGRMAPTTVQVVTAPFNNYAIGVCLIPPQPTTE